MTTRLAWRDGRNRGRGRWKADLCKHKANKQTNPRGRGNPQRPGNKFRPATPLKRKSVDSEFGGLKTKEGEKKHWFWQDFFHKRLIKTPEKCAHFFKILGSIFNTDAGKEKKKKERENGVSYIEDEEKAERRASRSTACEGRWRLRREEAGTSCLSVDCSREIHSHQRGSSADGTNPGGPVASGIRLVIYCTRRQ